MNTIQSELPSPLFCASDERISSCQCTVANLSHFALLRVHLNFGRCLFAHTKKILVFHKLQTSVLPGCGALQPSYEI